MIARIIDASIANRFFIVLAAIAVTLAGFWAVRATPVDAIPDLSDVQVVVRSNYPGQAPRIVEDQVTYPLATTMLSVPGAETVRGYSMFGDSFVYVIFEDGTDLYWARSRVLEYLNQVQNELPEGVTSSLGPDATGVGWIYEYALIDRTGNSDLAGLRSLQDWFLRYELQTIPGIAEVASVGGMVKQYQIVLEPYRMASLGVTHSDVVRAIQASNQEAGGSVVEMGEAEFMVRASGYLTSLEDFRQIPLKSVGNGIPVTLSDVATIQLGPEMRRGIAELNGEGEVAGGIVVLRQGEDARATIAAVEDKLEALQASLPEGVEIVTTYDRSKLIDASIENLTGKLVAEFIIVALVCALFLWHVRSALVAIVTLPLGVLAAFLVMRFQGVDANIMSLGGIAIAIGAMVDAAIVMIENAHKHIEHWEEDHPDEQMSND
ncbi:MAG: efflux RND transporter permease subunit, partial [Parvularcula sp.]|nr:efflux RND transporter permease subunit [Parvularcula sp.]